MKASSPKQWNVVASTAAWVAAAFAFACGSQTQETTARIQQPATFPTEWVPLQQAGGDLTDPIDDGGKNSREIVGTPYPAVYVAADDTNFMVRLRLDADPSQSSSVAPFGWGVLFDTDNDLNDYEFSLIVDGTGNPRSIVFGQNTVQATVGDPSDRIEAVLSSVPIDAAAGGNLRVVLADTTSNANPDYFLDFAVPLSILSAAGIGLSSPLRLIAGTSSSAQSLSLDVAGTGSAPGPGTLSSASSNPSYMDGHSADTDADGVVDPMDLDNDNDGIPDALENPLGMIADGDADNDLIPNYRDASDRGDGQPAGCTDAGADGVCDSLIVLFDADGDGVPNDLDLDSDDDGIVDSLEAGHGGDLDGDGLADGTYGSNGLADAVETSAGSGIVNYVRLDTDHDATFDFIDLDSDADGQFDLVEVGLSAQDGNADGRADGAADIDADGIRDAVDQRTDLFGHPLAVLPDTDNDKVPDPYDVADSGSDTGDSDGDGKLDDVECPVAWPCPDDNRDGTPNYMTSIVDQDGDGVADAVDVDTDNDGIPNDVEGIADADADGIPNSLDLDSDNDAIPDITEAKAKSLDVNGDGRIDDPTDSDGDGLADVAELTPNSSSSHAPLFPLPDTDSDGTPDSLDLDSDADSVSDLVEAGGADSNGDGIVDSTVDVDQDGLVAIVDPSAGGVSLLVLDTDSDMKRDFQDADDDGDGVFTQYESPDPNHDGRVPDALDTNLDGTPNYLDADDDGDSLPTSSESADPNGDGDPADAADTDNDGIADYLDAPDVTLDAGAGTGGAAATGGASAAGGLAATGGEPATGGVAATGGGANGGQNATGGSLPTGGAAATGGAAPTGGAPSTGGTNATGGAGSGGTSAAATGLGGATSTSGGASATGGSSDDAAAQTGGNESTGGATLTEVDSTPIQPRNSGAVIEGGGCSCKVNSTSRSDSGIALALVIGGAWLSRRRRPRGSAN